MRTHKSARFTAEEIAEYRRKMNDPKEWHVTKSRKETHKKKSIFARLFTPHQHEWVIERYDVGIVSYMEMKRCKKCKAVLYDRLRCKGV